MTRKYTIEEAIRVGLIFEFSDPYGRYNKQQFDPRKNINSTIKKSGRINKHYQDLDKSIYAKSKHNRYVPRNTKVDTAQMRGSMREIPNFGKRRNFGKFVRNSVNKWKRQRTLKRLGLKSNASRFGELGRGDAKQIAWDALDGVF